MLDELPSTDQDRIIANELHTSFRIWQQILGTFVIHPELHELLDIAEPIQIVVDSN
jgi:hypothetical protein